MGKKNDKNKNFSTPETKEEGKRMEGITPDSKSDLSTTNETHRREVEKKQDYRTRSEIMTASALAFLSQPPKSAFPQENNKKPIIKNKIEEDPYLTFPQKIMEILADKDNQDIIVWLPHGKAFIILQENKFASKILPRYFKRTKFTSFTRKLKRWGFGRIRGGPGTGAYYHKYFIRANLSLCEYMIYNPLKKEKKQHISKEYSASEYALLGKLEPLSNNCPTYLSPGSTLLANARKYFILTTPRASSTFLNREHIDCSIPYDQLLQAKDQKAPIDYCFTREMNTLCMEQEILLAEQNAFYMKQKQQMHSAIMQNAATALQLWKNIGLSESKCVAKPSIVKPTMTLQQQRDHFTRLGVMDPSLVPAMSQQHAEAAFMASQESMSSVSGMPMASNRATKASSAA